VTDAACQIAKQAENVYVGETSALFMPAVVVGVVYAFYLVIAAREAAGRRRRRAVVAAAWSSLDAASADLSTQTVTGLRGGLPATFYLRGDAAHIEIDVPSAELVLAISPRIVPARAVETGAIRTDDSAFDEAFLVEGAPADVVRCLLGMELRARLLEARPLTLSIEGSSLEVHGLPSLRPGDVAALIDLAAAVGSAVPRAVEEADRRLTLVTGTPYRPGIDASAVHAAQVARAEEVAGFMELMRERATAARRALVLAAVLGIILAFSLYASGS
jgi:hypothetical protein